MIESDVFVQALQDMGVNFFTGVPDSMLGGIIAELMTRKVYTPAVREDEAMALADRIGVLEQGRLIWSGPARAIPRCEDPRVRKFIDAVIVGSRSGTEDGPA